MRIFNNMLANECVWDKQGCANDLWKEILGESKGYIRHDKETWW